MKLSGRVCLITGGTSGIGAAAAMDLARRGADIAITGRNVSSAGADSVRAAVEALGARCLAIAGDLANPAECASAVEQTVAAFGRLDVVLHSAGEAAPGGLLEVTPEAWERAFQVHVHAVFHLCRAAAPHLMRQQGGAIVLVSSAAGIRGCAGALAYGVVKGAIPQFTRALARELAPHNIRVNAVAPGIIRTPFQNYLTPEQVKNNIENRIPLRREGSPDDVAAVIAMLLENEFVTGETVTIDGGMTMRIV